MNETTINAEHAETAEKTIWLCVFSAFRVVRWLGDQRGETETTINAGHAETAEKDQTGLRVFSGFGVVRRLHDKRGEAGQDEAADREPQRDGA